MIHLSQRAQYRLDGLNFFMADVQGGLGPYLAIYLSITRHWPPAHIALAMGASSFGTMICQLPAGIWIDSTSYKARLIIGGCLIAGLSSLAILITNHFWLILFLQFALGAASSLLAPAVASFSLDKVPSSAHETRLARNSFFNHAGTALTAITIGVLGQKTGMTTAFSLCAFSTLCAIIFVTERSSPTCVRQQTSRKNIFIDLHRCISLKISLFLLTVLLFHLANAAMLPMAGTALAHFHPGKDVIAMSSCIIGAQLVMVGVSALIYRLFQHKIHAATLYGVALSILPMRGLLFSWLTYHNFMSMTAMVAVQLLDGVAMGIFNITSLVLASQLSKTNTHENSHNYFGLMQAMVALATSVGAMGSNFIASFLMEIGNFPIMFTGLSFFSLIACFFYGLWYRIFR